MPGNLRRGVAGVQREIVGASPLGVVGLPLARSRRHRRLRT